MSRASFGKPLKGIGSISAQLLDDIADSINSNLSSGAIALTNVNITGGTINGVVLGTNQSNIGVFTTIVSGSPGGEGYSVCFFGLIPGDSVCWVPSTGTWNILGNLSTSKISNLGNLRISGNTISSTNSNGNINLSPNGTGLTVINSGIFQNTTNGNISLSSTNGSYSLNSLSNTSTSTLDTTIITNNGNINLETGLTNVSKIINFISTGSVVSVSTLLPHELSIGSTVTLSNTNSIPNINGVFTVQSVPSTTTFNVTPISPVITSGTSGDLIKHNDINLTASNQVNIPRDVKLTFGDTCQNINSGSNQQLNINACADINLNAIGNINIPNNVGISFDSVNDTKRILSDGTNLLLNTGVNDFIITSNKTTINGDLQVNGNTVYVTSTNVNITDPIFTLGGQENTQLLADDNKDRGIQFLWHNGVSSLKGFFGYSNATNCFTYIPDAIETNSVFTGTPGCVNFGQINSTGLNIQNGNITNVGTLSTCNITCNNNMIISSSNSINITSPSNSITGDLNVNGTINTCNIYCSSTMNISAANNLNLNTGSITNNNINTSTPIIIVGGITSPASFSNVDYGIQYRYYDNNSNSAKSGWFGVDSSDNTFKFIPEATNTNNVISGQLGNAEFNQIDVTDLTVTGTLTLPTTVSTVLTTEHISLTGGSSGSPSAAINVTFIEITSAGIATGTLPPGTIDGFPKYIMITSIVVGGQYSLAAPTGRFVDAGSGTAASKTITFNYSGQSMFLIWNDVADIYILVNGGACIS